jgi:hypothetical protein
MMNMMKQMIVIAAMVLVAPAARAGDKDAGAGCDGVSTPESSIA